MSNVIDEEHLRKCAHEPCICMVYPEQGYFSTHCSMASEAVSPELSCDCGLRNCALKGLRKDKPELLIHAGSQAAL